MSEIRYFFNNPVVEKVREEGREEGRVEARSEIALETLEWRGISVSDAVRERVLSFADPEQLKTWSQQAVQVTRAGDLFAGEGPDNRAGMVCQQPVLSRPGPVCW